MAKLLVHESAGIREFEIIDNEVHMGRELDNTLRLPDPSISRHHCVIRKVGGGFEIQDLQSSNGVLVNGNRVQASPKKETTRLSNIQSYCNTLVMNYGSFWDLWCGVCP